MYSTCASNSSSCFKSSQSREIISLNSFISLTPFKRKCHHFPPREVNRLQGFPLLNIHYNTYVEKSQTCVWRFFYFFKLITSCHSEQRRGIPRGMRWAFQNSQPRPRNIGLTFQHFSPRPRGGLSTQSSALRSQSVEMTSLNIPRSQSLCRFP